MPWVAIHSSRPTSIHTMNIARYYVMRRSLIQIVTVDESDSNFDIRKSNHVIILMIKLTMMVFGLTTINLVMNLNRA